jgi:NAD(P)H-hydrate epimerase
MQSAGEAAARAIAARWSKRPVQILCGPGNNGGDGYVCAAWLAAAGWPVELAALGDPAQLKGDAALARAGWTGPITALDALAPRPGALLVDALFGAGLTRPLEGEAARWAQISRGEGRIIIALDTPSGLDGDRAEALGPVFRADLTVTFHRFKPAHLLEPGRSLCGELVCAAIGIPKGWEGKREPNALINSPALWSRRLNALSDSDHKHKRGRLCVFSGRSSATGAARLAALGGLRAGAGLVTLLSPPDAMLVNAAHSSAIMLARWRGPDLAGDLLAERRASAAVIGPAGGVGSDMRDAVLDALAGPAPIVIDADALTSFADDPAPLFQALRPGDVLTPHEGEFARLFPQIASADGNKLEKARAASGASGAVLLLKGPDTVIAQPNGVCAVNLNASPRLATAGSGDVLAGMIGGLLAQGVFAFEAACAAAWLHGEAGRLLKPGGTAEDLIALIPSARDRLESLVSRSAMLDRLRLEAHEAF